MPKRVQHRTREGIENVNINVSLVDKRHGNGRALSAAVSSARLRMERQRCTRCKKREC